MKIRLFLVFTLLGILYSQELKTPKESYLISGDIYLPFNNQGVLADVNHPFQGSTMQYKGNTVIFSAGFYLSGYSNDELWTNGVASSGLIQDYQPGEVGSTLGSTGNGIYSVAKTDEPFGDAWLNWKYAVENGAYYYDGDKNGIYDPIDHNNNGYWELNEDRPDLLYDQTHFTVYHDGIDPRKRRYNTVGIQGIEIRQTIFAASGNEYLRNIIFVRYSIVNRGIKADTLKDVIFSAWVDPDIGSYEDNLLGCDTTVHSGFTFNKGYDEIFGDNSPALFATIVSGPKVKSTDEDTAYFNYGSLIGRQSFAGYKNSGMASHSGIYSCGQLECPEGPEVMRGKMEGKRYTGEFFDPCSDSTYGKVVNMNCEDVDPKFWYSGDPVRNIGWLNKRRTDVRQFVNTEMFDLVKDKPQDIIVAYIVSEGYLDVSPISVGRELARITIEEYKNNFPNAVDFNDLPKDPTEISYNYKLDQNYPNPFNSNTTINFSLPGRLDLTDPASNDNIFVKLEVYDQLGRLVKVLVDEQLPPGNYSETFDASNLSSGVYFYKLSYGSNNFATVKKMMLLQ